MALNLSFYLKRPSKDSIIIMFNESYNTNLTPLEIEVSTPTALSATLTQVTLSRKNLTIEDIREHYIGSNIFRYHRLQLSSIFGSNLKIDFQLPITVTTLIDSLREHTKIKLDNNDFIDGVIRSFPYRLNANPSSLRWVGFIDLVSSMETIESQMPGDTINGFIHGNINDTIVINENRI